MSDMIVIDNVGVSVGLRCVPDSCGSIDFALASDVVADDGKKKVPRPDHMVTAVTLEMRPSLSTPLRRRRVEPYDRKKGREC